MRALFNKFTSLSRDRSKDSSSSSAYQREKPVLGKLPEWPPRSSDTPSSTPSVTKPLPEITQRPLPQIESPEPLSTSLSLDGLSLSSGPHRGALSDVLEEEPIDASVVMRTVSPKPIATGESSGRSSRRATKDGAMSTNTTDAPKRVAFISPPPTPSALHAVRSLPEESQTITKSSSSRPPQSHSRDARGSTSTAASTSRTDVASSRTVKATSTRTATSPHPGKSYIDAMSVQQSLRSGTPYSQRSTTTSIVPPASWSEGAEGDLVSNLGERERTRQEVLWEIVASEERYVAELLKMRDTFIAPLLHPFATSPIGSPTPGDYEEFTRYDAHVKSLDHLPIAARFLSPLGTRSDTPNTFTSRKDEKDTPNMDTESTASDDDLGPMNRSYSDSRKNPSALAKHNHPRSPYGTQRPSTKSTTVPFPTRSHHSLPPPPRINATDSTQSLGRQSYINTAPEREKGRSTPTPTQSAQHRGLLRKSKKSLTKSTLIPNGAVAPHRLPDDLRLCLEAIENCILEGHLKLSDGLRKRYEEQYPLVRSLADVFVANSHILRGYADYVLHLERALDQVQEASSTSSTGKHAKKHDSDEWHKFCTFLRRLENDAQEKGETGLAISLSKPFQRLLKYPLLFQNLLYHTDPSTFEYESTLQMVAEVETIVRSIEDDKIQKEERDKTRDVLARIDGLEKTRQLAAPKPSRVLVEERPLETKFELSKSSTPPVSGGKAVKGKTSFKRLSDVVGKKDMWLVVFNDVTLRCQRVGTTSLPLGSTHSSRAISLPEIQGGKSKYATTGRRNSHTRPRNMYKFVEVESWAIGQVAQPQEGVVSKDEVRTRQQAHFRVQPRIVPMPEEDEEGGAVDSDDSDRKSKMSFSYWGADKITLQKPVVKAKQSTGTGSRRPDAGVARGYSRESSANAKFGTRLLIGDSAHPPRSGSRRAHTPGNTRRAGPHSDEGHAVKVTVTRPEWNVSTRSTSTPTSAAKRVRNTSQTSNATSKNKLLASPAPSEDSGVGLYRQITSKDSPLNI